MAPRRRGLRRGRSTALGALAVAACWGCSPALADPADTATTGEPAGTSESPATGGTAATMGTHTTPPATGGTPSSTGPLSSTGPPSTAEAPEPGKPTGQRAARKHRRRHRGADRRRKTHGRHRHKAHRHRRKAHRHGRDRGMGKVRITLAARRTGGTPWVAPVRPGASPGPYAPGVAQLSDPDDAPGAAAGPGGMLANLPAGSLDTSTPVILPADISAAPAAPPPFLIPIYKSAARRYHVPWRVLAAINSIETGYGRDLSVSPKGAVGWMQFMPGTWRVYGGGGDPYDPHDAIFAAARLLRAAGASRDLRRAIFAYNHAAWYVAEVLWRASTIAERAHASSSAGGYALPLDARYMRQLGRTDDGVDIETAPDGAAVYSIGPGIVTAVASDPAGFGPNYPVVLLTAGPLAGQYVYYGHVAASLVHPGERVFAGEPIAIVGHTGDAQALGHGHIEIGFCDAGGDPLDHHGTDAWTPSGQAMRTVLVALSQRFGISNS